MRDTDCIAFLQWSLPQLGLRWPGFRKVRRQVCKRISRRMKELELDTFEQYRDQLVNDREVGTTGSGCGRKDSLRKRSAWANSSRISEAKPKKVIRGRPPSMR